MKKRILILLGILIIGGGTAGICWKTGVFGQQEVSGDAVYVTPVSYTHLEHRRHLRQNN